MTFRKRRNYYAIQLLFLLLLSPGASIATSITAQKKRLKDYKRLRQMLIFVLQVLNKYPCHASTWVN
jgi:hypothetical protein